MSDIVTTGIDKKARDNERTMHSTTGCDMCKYCGVQNTFDKTLVLICRRKPPVAQAALVMSQQGPVWQSATVWPNVQKHEWCGCFSPKEH